jgi:PadR family transcriptional regulator, regulatory protein AphA
LEIKYAILGFLSWKPFTGYELKKMIADSIVFYWSGNNNQIYTSLVQMHKDGLVTNEVEHQEHLPSRKIYSITDKGLEHLHYWVTSSLELPQLKKPFLMQLAWSDSLSDDELQALLEKYEYEVRMQLLMLQEQARRKAQLNPSRTPRENHIWESIFDNFIQTYQTEMEWAETLRKELASKGGSSINE